MRQICEHLPALAAPHIRTATEILIDTGRRPEDVLFVREHTRTPLIAKIEKPQGVERAEEILKVSDCVMVARGDLGVEMPIEEVPMIQKRLLALAGAMARPSGAAPSGASGLVTRPARRSSWPWRYLAGLPMSSQ